MGSSTYPGRYLKLNQAASKQLNLVVEIEGIPGYFAVVPIYQNLVYGDPRLKYGLTGLKYGGLVIVPNVRPWIMWDSSCTISQANEPEQGRSSISTMTLKFIDYEGYMTQLISPGFLLDEPLGDKLCTVYMGYTNSAFPNDYYKAFRGYISSTTSGAGWVQLEFSDANIKTRQTICVGGVSTSVNDVSTTDSVLSAGSVSGFFAPVLGFNNRYVDWQIQDNLLLASTTTGSNVINVIIFPSSPVIAEGDPIAGPGIPVGAVVETISGDTITMSANATATTYGVPIDVIATINDSADSDQTVRAWVKIDDEWMEYSAYGFIQGGQFIADQNAFTSPTVLTNWVDPTGFAPGSTITGTGIPADTVIIAIDPVDQTVTISNPVTLSLIANTITVIPNLIVFRGGEFSRGQSVATHAISTQIDNAVQLQGNVIDLILKMYLSGFGGPWVSDVSCVALGTILVAGVNAFNAILFGVDVIDVYGLVPGDQIQVTNSTEGNNGSYIIASIVDDISGNPNRIVYVQNPTLLPVFTVENPASSVTLAFRSQYDTLPIGCGLSNTPQDIDIQGFLDAKATYFSTGQFVAQLFIQSSVTGKDFIESELFLPYGAYSITVQGKLSIAVTSPPLLGQKLIQLDQSNVVTPQNITVQRALNTRRFYNLIQYNYDEDDSGNFNSQANLIDANSEASVNMTTSLPINSLGLKTSLGGALVVQSRGTALLNRFGDAAYEITLSVNWEAGSQIEVGDVVILYDPITPTSPQGTLQISDLENGVRGLGTKLFEVLSRSLKPQSGSADLVLLSSLGYSVSQRYATISPSSIVGLASTSAMVNITDSFGPLYPGNEPRKWTNILGCTVCVHAPDWSYSDTAVLMGFNPANPYQMVLGSALDFTPSAGDIVDVQEYGTGTDPSFNEEAKLFYVFINPSLTVVSGTSQTVFTVSSGDAAQLNVGQPIQMHNADFSQTPEGNILTNEVLIKSIVGTTITTEKPLGTLPSAGMIIEGVGFKDGGAPYRCV